MRAYRQHTGSTRHPRLRPLSSGCEPLEERQLLSATPWDSQPSLSDLRVEADTFHPSHVLVSFRDAPPAEFDADRLGNGDLWKVNLPDGQTVDEALADLSARDDILYALPDYQIRADYIPNDAQFGKMWGLSNTGQTGGTVDADIDAPEAWDVTRGSSSIVVAVIDTGVDYNHPDLKANVWLNADEIPGNRIDDDRNGYIDDIYGWDFANDDSNPMDDNGHGTHVAGTIAALGNNALGVTGVAPGVKLMALKFLDSTGSGYTSDAILALDYAVANGARISNNSWGGAMPFEQPLADAIQRAAAANHLVVAAAGNGNWSGSTFLGANNNDASARYPAGYRPTPDTLISVAATDHTDSYAWFSNYGATTVDLAAPGVGILSTVPASGALSSASGYGYSSGTSMATPHVAGAAALVWSANPKLTAAGVKDLLLRNSDSIADSSRPTLTNGRLNANRAVRAATGNVSSPVTPVPTDKPPTVDITRPAATEVSGTVLVTAAATDDRGVAAVDFYVDGAKIGSDTSGADGWSTTWTTTKYVDGSHTLTAVARDTAGQSGSDRVAVQVKNSVPAGLHVADIDGRAERAWYSWSNYNWRAQVLVSVVDASGRPVAGASLSGAWTGGYVANITNVRTDQNGLALVSSGWIRSSVASTAFRVTGISHPALAYQPAANRDADGDSSGTAINVYRDGLARPASEAWGAATTRFTADQGHERLLRELAVSQSLARRSETGREPTDRAAAVDSLLARGMFG